MSKERGDIITTDSFLVLVQAPKGKKQGVKRKGSDPGKKTTFERVIMST